MIEIDVDFILNILKSKKGKARLEDFLSDYPLPKNILAGENETSFALAIIKRLFIMVENQYIRIETSTGQEPTFIMLKDIG